MTMSSARPTLGIPQALAERGLPERSATEDARVRAAFEGHFELVWRSLRRFGVPAGTADDAAQHVFLTLADRLGNVEVGRERAFLVATAVRVAANVRRRFERAREDAFDELEPLADPCASPETLLEEKDRRLALDRALAALPLEQRAVFVLYELEGFTLPEIAESLAIPLGTATSRLRRARDRFEAWALAQGGKGTSP